MTLSLASPAVRFRVLCIRWLRWLGFSDQAFLLVLAVLVGIVTAGAAVGFHELIVFIRDLLYLRYSAESLYGRHLWLIFLYPTLGGLVVGVVVNYVLRAGEGHGIVDVIESVIRTRGFQRPAVALEKIITSALTIGSGGSAGAEGPIVQIGAAIASGVGQVFGLARQQMPILTGCGCAAGISAIFNAPFGGVLFTLEVILQDFSIRAFTPIVVASVIAQVSTLAIYQHIGSHEEYRAIFAMPAKEVIAHPLLDWGQVAGFMLLGMVCGLAGLALTRLMQYGEERFRSLKLPRVFTPALGGAMLGATGVVYVLIFGRLLMHRLKPFDFATYPPPAFFSDGYGVVQQLLVSTFPGYQGFDGRLLLLLLFLCGIKIVGTCMTLASGGSGGVIAPSIFIGATAGASLGILLKTTTPFHGVQPELYALVGMGAVLAANIHAPLASILIVFELTQDYKVMLPAMLACVLAVSVARMLYADSLYTQSLRRRGLSFAGPSDLNLLRRMSVEQAPLDPAISVHVNDPFQKVLDLSAAHPSSDFVVVGADGMYAGMIVASDITLALLEREAIPLLTCGDLMRANIKPVATTDDLAAVLDCFTRTDVARLPVTVAAHPGHIVGLVGRAGLMRRYQEELAKTR